MKENLIKDKSFKFAVRIINLYNYLKDEKKEYVLSKQLLRSGTSVGALIRESEHSESKKDFIHKFSISQKEINETLYWLELLNSTQIITLKQFESLYEDAIELLKIITKIILTSKKNA